MAEFQTIFTALRDHWQCSMTHLYNLDFVLLKRSFDQGASIRLHPLRSSLNYHQYGSLFIHYLHCKFFFISFLLVSSKLSVYKQFCQLL